ncbi:MAG TPA: hypothetical protein VFZ68_09450, partial [Acidimicrobiales bacterium]
WNLAACGTPDAGSKINAALDPLIDQYFHTARRQGRREDREAYAFDALLQLATSHTHASTSRPAGSAAATGGATPGATASIPTGDPAQVGDDTATGATPAQTAIPGLDPDTTHPRNDDTAAAAEGDAGPPAPRRVTNPTHLALLRVDVEALQRGRAEEGELCEIAGVGPVAVSAARALLPESVLELVITRGVDVANVTHLGRGPSAAQRIALLWTSPGCDVETCPRQNPRGIQHDHRTPWADCHETVLGNLDRKCGHHHHDLKTHHDWELVPGTGPRPMVPPDHPDHPDNHLASPSDHPGDPPP